MITNVSWLNDGEVLDVDPAVLERIVAEGASGVVGGKLCGVSVASQRQRAEVQLTPIAQPPTTPQPAPPPPREKRKRRMEMEEWCGATACIQCPFWDRQECGVPVCLRLRLRPRLVGEYCMGCTYLVEGECTLPEKPLRKRRV